MKRTYAFLLFMTINLHASLPTLQELQAYIIHTEQRENEIEHNREPVLSSWQTGTLLGVLLLNIVGITGNILLMKSQGSDTSLPEIIQATQRAIIIMGYILSTI